MAMTMTQTRGRVEQSVGFAGCLDAFDDLSFVESRAAADRFVLFARLVDEAYPRGKQGCESWYDRDPEEPYIDADGGIWPVLDLPPVRVGAVAEIAARIGRSQMVTKNMLYEAVLVRRMLPQVWEMVQQLRIDVGVVKMIARSVSPRLSNKGFKVLDDQLVKFPRRVGAMVARRMLTEVHRRFMGNEPVRQARRLGVRFNNSGRIGPDRTTMEGTLDPADAQALEKALRTIATDLGKAGDNSSFDERMAKACGVVGEAALEMQQTPPAPSDGNGGTPADRLTPRRDLRLYVVVKGDTITGGPEAQTLLRLNGKQDLSVEQLKAWCASPFWNIKVTKVIDLNQPIVSDCYPPSAPQREHVALQYGHCVFPSCEHLAHPVSVQLNEDGTLLDSWDADHVDAWIEGQITSTDDLAPLCRTHHRLKTHEGWISRQVAPRAFVWVSPLGQTYLVTPDTTVDITKLVARAPFERRRLLLASQDWLDPGPDVSLWDFDDD